MSSSITSTKSSSSMRIRYSCSHDDSKNHGTPTDYQKDSVSKPGSPSSLNRIDLTLLFAIDLRNQKLQLRKICRNCRLSLPNNVLCIHRLDQVCRSPAPVRCSEEVTAYLQSKEPILHYAGSEDHLTGIVPLNCVL